MMAAEAAAEARVEFRWGAQGLGLHPAAAAAVAAAAAAAVAAAALSLAVLGASVITEAAMMTTSHASCAFLMSLSCCQAVAAC
jgi:hypothetical protein